MTRRFLPVIVIVSLLVSGCQPAPREHKTTLMVFGTLVTITLWDVEANRAEQAVNTIAEDFQYQHTAWHAWKPGSMGRMNQLLATTGEFSANPSVLPLITRAQELAPQSQGLFNPAIGKLIRLWGFHQDELLANSPPDPQQIAELVAQNPQVSDIEIKSVRVQSHNPAVQLDMGAMAKGLAVDRAIDYLRSVGIQDALINAGGDLKAIGSHGERAWRVGIRHPRKSCQNQELRNCMIAFLEVQDNEAVFTSGDYERYFEYAGKRYHHIIDPRSGYPADQTTSVTVIHPDAATADAAATALFIAGPDLWPQIAVAMGIDYVMLIDKQGRIYLTPPMAERLQWAEPQTDLRIQQP